MRNLLIAGNWKMNIGGRETQYLLKGIEERRHTGPQNVDVLVCPPFISLGIAAKLLKESYITLGAQNVHFEDNGAYTGEISTQMLSEVNCTHIIVGHSERRQYFGETNEIVNKKVKKVISAGIQPIVCVGETLDQRRESKHKEVVKNQVKQALDGVEYDEAHQVVIAYEPIWAIGTGETAEPEQAEEMHEMIRKNLAAQFNDEISDDIQVVYGGSMKPGNARALLEQDNIDGGLVGGASLRARAFDQIIEVASNLN